MRKLLILALAALTLAACAPKPKLVIIHTNDTHSHLEPIRTGEDMGRGGIIERAAFVDSVRRAQGAGRVLLLHAGDFGQGTSYFSEFGGELEIDMLNALGYDCVTLGNHEFDNGLEDLAKRLSRLECPVVCANIDLAPVGLDQYVKPYVILERAGMKIGIIGTTSDLSTNVAASISSRIQQLDTVESVNKCISEIREACDLVILLSHSGFDEDCELVPQTRGLDLVIGGHSHYDLDEVRELIDADGNKVPMVTDGAYGINLGEVKVW